jgi:acyl carrier protein
VHAAGVTRGPSLQPCHALRGEHFDDQLRPKGAGTENIADVFRDAKLDFCLAFSSLAAVLGGSGFAAYAAANSYLNACVVRERRRGHPWLSVHWDAWRAPDGAAQRPVDHLDDESGWQAFERCVALCRSTSDAASVVVGCGDMDARWLRWREHAGLGKISSVDSVSESDLLDEQGIVARLVAIWVEALGEPTADSQTRLLDAGGHSMTALQISGDIERLYGVELMLDEILILGSPSAIAERIRAELLREARPTFRT